MNWKVIPNYSLETAFSRKTTPWNNMSVMIFLIIMGWKEDVHIQTSSCGNGWNRLGIRTALNHLQSRAPIRVRLKHTITVQRLTPFAVQGLAHGLQQIYPSTGSQQPVGFGYTGDHATQRLYGITTNHYKDPCSTTGKKKDLSFVNLLIIDLYRVHSFPHLCVSCLGG